MTLKSFPHFTRLITVQESDILRCVSHPENNTLKFEITISIIQIQEEKPFPQATSKKHDGQLNCRHTQGNSCASNEKGSFQKSKCNGTSNNGNVVNELGLEETVATLSELRHSDSILLSTAELLFRFDVGYCGEKTGKTRNLTWPPTQQLSGTWPAL